ncbi:TraG family conjugative transposon ATPase, partial [Porphyromonas gulae]
MRNSSKMSTLEAKFPLLSIEQGCIVSKEADITVAFRVELPELFTVTSAEYEAMHSAWHKAIKVLPNFSIVHKQDWFITEEYRGKLSEGGLGFLARSSERHFNERPYLHHSVYLFLTKSNKKRMAQQSNFSTLCRGHLIPKEIEDKEAVIKFMEAVDQFERIINDTMLIRLERMTEEELVGTKEKSGLLDRYFSLSDEHHASLEDIRLGADLVRVGDNRLCLHTLSDTDDLPTAVSTDSRYERLSTDRSDCRLSFASPVGLMLSCN